MSTSPWIELLAILVLVLINGFFALAEFSVIASRKSRLQQKVADQKRGASEALGLREKPERFLATIQVGITLVGAMVGVFSGATIVDRLADILRQIPILHIQQFSQSVSMVIVVIAVTVLSVSLGELVPKYLALSHPERFARLVAKPITIFIRITSIFSRALSGLSRFIVSMFGVRRTADEAIVTEDEINQMIIEGMEKGVFDETESQFVRSVFDFADSTVSRAMRPRTDVVALANTATGTDLLRAVNQHGYSRYPVFETSIDNVVGIVYAKDLLTTGDDPAEIKVDDIMRKPFFVPDSMPLSKLLREFQKGSNHLAIVLDEYGGTDGIITLEDILEELVGEIRDEYDVEQPLIVKHSDTVAYADATVWPGEINELLSCRLPEDNIDTLAGLFIDTVGHLPEKHETVRIADARLTVLAKDENRIVRLKIEKVEPVESADE
jgi:putative hemolysin